MQYDINTTVAATIVTQISIIAKLQQSIQSGNIHLSEALAVNCDALSSIAEAVHTGNLSGALTLNDEAINTIVARSVLNEAYGESADASKDQQD